MSVERIAAALAKIGFGEELATIGAETLETLISRLQRGEKVTRIDIAALRNRRRLLRAQREAKLLAAKMGLAR